MSYIGENTDKRLNLLPGVNLAATGQTLLFTVPSGKNCIVTDIRLEVAQADAVISVPSLRVGKASNYDEWLPITAMTGLDAVGEFVNLSTAANLLIRKKFAAGDAIKIDITTAGVATALTANIHVFGYIY